MCLLLTNADLLHVNQLLVQVFKALGVVRDDALYSFDPRGLVGYVDYVAAFALELLEDFVLGVFREGSVECLGILACFVQDCLLGFGQLVPCVVADNDLDAPRVWPSRIRLFATSGNALDL